MAHDSAHARRFVIVDAHSHALRAYHALGPMTAPDGLPTNAIFGLAGLLHRLVFEDRPDYLAIVFDAPDDSRTTFRSALYPAYKANRSARPADLTVQMPYLRDLARAFGLTALEHASYEADDLVAALVQGAEVLGLQTTVLSADKDLMQLVSERTTLWDSMRGRRYTPAAVKEKLGVPPSAVADYLALVGDSSDNVPGVSGIGPKSAARLLDAYGDLDGVFAHLDALPARERTRLESCRELAFLSRTLTRLAADAPLPCPFEAFALKAPPIAPLAELFTRLGLRAFALPGGDSPPAPIAATRPAPRPAREPAPAPASLFDERPDKAVSMPGTSLATGPARGARDSNPIPTLGPARGTPDSNPTPARGARDSNPTPTLGAPDSNPTPTLGATDSPTPTLEPARDSNPTPTLGPAPAVEPEPTPAIAPAPAPARPRRLRPSPSELARFIAGIDPTQVQGVVLSFHHDVLELTVNDLVLEVSLRGPTPDRAQDRSPRTGQRAGLQPSLFDTPTPLSGPELAALLIRHLGPEAALVPLVRGETREPALPALSRWGVA